MTSARLTALVVGSALLTTWLVSAGVTRQAEDRLPPPAPPSPVDPIALASANLVDQTARLRAHRAAVPAPRLVARNPFRFGHAGSPEPPPRRSGDAGSTGAPPDIGAAMVTPPAPMLRLIGIAIDGEPDRPVRTAALSIGGEVVLVRSGDEVAGRYRVTAISPDVVELTDQLGGPPVRLPIR